MGIVARTLMVRVPRTMLLLCGASLLAGAAITVIVVKFFFAGPTIEVRRGEERIAEISAIGAPVVVSTMFKNVTVTQGDRELRLSTRDVATLAAGMRALTTALGEDSYRDAVREVSADFYLPGSEPSRVAVGVGGTAGDREFWIGMATGREHAARIRSKDWHRLAGAMEIAARSASR